MLKQGYSILSLLSSTSSFGSEGTVRYKLPEDGGFTYLKDVPGLIFGDKRLYFVYFFNRFRRIDFCRCCFAVLNIFLDLKTSLEPI
jgi:hypothetical protein